MELSTVAYDVEAIESGAWIDAPDVFLRGEIINFTGVKFKVIGLGSKAFNEYVESIDKPKIAIDAKLTGEELEQATNFAKRREAFYEMGLLDWSGFTSNGKEVPYSKEQAYEFMMTDKFEAVALGVHMAAAEVSRLKDTKVEAVKKSLKKL